MPEVKPLPERGVAVLVEIIGQLAEARDADAESYRRDMEARGAEVVALRGQYERASHESENRLAEIQRLAARVDELEDRDSDEDLRINIRSLQHELHEARALRDAALRKLDSAEHRLEKMRTDRDEWRSPADAASELAQIRAIVAERDAAQRAAAAWSREAADRGVALDVLKAGLRNLLDEVTPKGDDV